MCEETQDGQAHRGRQRPAAHQRDGNALGGVAQGPRRPDEVRAAQQEILRYRPAIYRYLLACLANADAAEEVLANFSYRFVRGDFPQRRPREGPLPVTCPAKAIYHLIIDYHKSGKKDKFQQMSPWRPRAGGVARLDLRLRPAVPRDLAIDPVEQGLGRRHLEERRTGRPLHTVLHFRAGHPEMRSAQMAEELGKAASARPSPATGCGNGSASPVTASPTCCSKRSTSSLHHLMPEAVEEELIDLQLFEYCKTAVAAWREQLRDKSA
ncbi:MAG: hypothetical protein U0797_11255 [Gemmataceae bacterium]